MSIAQASFTLRGHNPDVLTCIANLSNDEVFTPPEFANQMLDTLAAAWANANDGQASGPIRMSAPRPLHQVGGVPPRDRSPPHRRIDLGDS